MARIAGIFNNNQQFKDAVDVTEVYRLSDTTNIDVNRQNAKLLYAERVRNSGKTL